MPYIALPLYAWGVSGTTCEHFSRSGGVHLGLLLWCLMTSPWAPGCFLQALEARSQLLEPGRFFQGEALALCNSIKEGLTA